MKKCIFMLTLFFIIILCSCSNNTTIKNEQTNSNLKENLSNEIKKESSNHITFSTPYEITECYNGYFIATTNDGRLYGMLDSKGNVVLDFIYDNLSFGENESARRENIIYASTEDGDGIIDFNGDIVIPFKYGEIKEYTEYCDYTFAKSQNGLCLISENFEETILDISIVRDELIFIYPLGDTYFEARSTSESTIYNLEGQKLASYVVTPLCERVSEKYTGIQEIIYKDNRYTIKLSFYDNDFNLCSTIEEPSLSTQSTSFSVKEYVSEETGIVELNSGEEALIEYSTGNISTDFDKNINKEKTVSVVSKSDTYRIYDHEGNDIFNERFYDVEKLSNDYMLVENLDGNTALINRYGKVMYDFGTITENTIYGYEKKTELFNKDMYCAVVNNGENNTIYAFIN